MLAFKDCGFAKHAIRLSNGGWLIKSSEAAGLVAKPKAVMEPCNWLSWFPFKRCSAATMLARAN